MLVYEVVNIPSLAPLLFQEKVGVEVKTEHLRIKNGQFEHVK